MSLRSGRRMGPKVGRGRAVLMGMSNQPVWRVMTSRGHLGRAWDELSAVERAEILAEYGYHAVLERMYWRKS